MNRFFSFLFVLGLCIGGYVWLRPINPCEISFEYRLGILDERFGISREEVLQILLDVETFWETPTQKNLFTYNPEASYTIDFIFDDRQIRTNTVNKSSQKLNDMKSIFDEFQLRYEQEKVKYESLIQEYEQKKSVYEIDLSQINQRIQDWNKNPSFDPNIRAELERDQKSIQQRQQLLLNEQLDIAQQQEIVNSIAQEANVLQTEYNRAVEEFNALYSDGREFSQGTWFPDRIEIYEFENEQRLKFLLAHEFGHALGVDHVSDPTSIMHAYMEEQPLDTQTVSVFDINALYAVCGIE